MGKKNVTPLSVLATLASVILAFLFVSCDRTAQKPKEDPAAAAYRLEIDTWHAERIRGLKKEYGWLTLAALTWLKEGRNEIASLGTVTVKKGVPFVTIDPAVSATRSAKKFSSGPVRTDAAKGGADTVFAGSRAHIIIRRGDRVAVRIFDAASKARKEFTGIDRYPVSDRWKIDARWEPYATPKIVVIETVIPGYFDKGFATGAAVFTVDGREYRLEPTVDEERTDYFFVFGDKTNGAGTYGAGRFLHAGPPKDGRIILDFNKATNPPCAFTEFATCPLPSADSRLSLRIEAGEKNYGHH